MRALVFCRVAAVSSMVQRGQGAEVLPLELLADPASPLALGLAEIGFCEPQKGQTCFPASPSRTALAAARSSETGTLASGDACCGEPYAGEPFAAGPLAVGAIGGSDSRVIG